jgi:hypothetical protein
MELSDEEELARAVALSLGQEYIPPSASGTFFQNA